jgi:TRAP-type C4-dicarboxylate transport system permease small subunit
MERLLNLIDLLCRRLTCVFYVVIVLLGFLHVLSRYVFNNPIIWIDELSKYLFIWLTFIGVVLAARRKAHFVADFFVNLFPARARVVLDVAARLLSLSFLALCVWLTPGLMKITQNSISSTVGIPLSWVYAGILVGFFLTLLVEAIDFYNVYFCRCQPTPKGGDEPC